MIHKYCGEKSESMSSSCKCECLGGELDEEEDDSCWSLLFVQGSKQG